MITVIVEDSGCYIYNIEDWKILRTKYRITGEILGNNFRIPSLPLKLLPEEALLLSRKGIATMLRYPKIQSMPHNNDKVLFCKFKEDLFKQQENMYEKIRKSQVDYISDKIVSGKRKFGDTRCKEQIVKEELNKSSGVNNDTMLWPVFCQHPEIGEPINVLDNEIINQISIPKLTAFIDLWEKGYYVTPGNKFGGDYLLYLGDPIQYHSLNIVHCIEDADKHYSLGELVAISRLGTSVKKRSLLANVKDDNSVLYITLNWIEA